jgi:hypothetical protein
MSRKYRHQGYMDAERDESRGPRKPPPRENLTPEERIQKRSLRHAIAREANEVVRCHNCGRNVPGLEPITPESRCPSCGVEVHCCRTCRHFDSAARWQCRAAIAGPVADKGRGNDCALYVPRLVLDTTGRRSGSAGGGAGGPKEQFENLFKR